MNITDINRNDGSKSAILNLIKHILFYSNGQAICQVPYSPDIVVHIIERGRIFREKLMFIMELG